MIDPAELTVRELRDHVGSVDDADTLREMREAEADGKDRATALDAIDERLDDLADDGDDDAVGTGPDAAEAADDADTERIVVRNIDSEGKHVAGYSFDPGRSRTVPANAAVKLAIKHGELQYVGTPR